MTVGRPGRKQRANECVSGARGCESHGVRVRTEHIPPSAHTSRAARGRFDASGCGNHAILPSICHESPARAPPHGRPDRTDVEARGREARCTSWPVKTEKKIRALTYAPAPRPVSHLVVTHVLMKVESCAALYDGLTVSRSSTSSLPLPRAVPATPPPVALKCLIAQTLAVAWRALLRRRLSCAHARASKP